MVNILLFLEADFEVQDKLHSNSGGCLDNYFTHAVLYVNV